MVTVAHASHGSRSNWATWALQPPWFCSCLSFRSSPLCPLSLLTPRYTVSQPKGEDWKFSVGRVTQAMFDEHLFKSAGEDHLALMCGPPAMLEHCVEPFLAAMGYGKEQMIHF